MFTYIHICINKNILVMATLLICTKSNGKLFLGDCLHIHTYGRMLSSLELLYVGNFLDYKAKCEISINSR